MIFILNLYFCLSYWHEYLISYERKILTWLLEKRRNLSWDLHRCWKLELESHHLQTSQTYVDCKYMYLYSFNGKKLIENYFTVYTFIIMHYIYIHIYIYIYIPVYTVLHISVKDTQFACKKISLAPQCKFSNLKSVLQCFF